MFDNENDLSIDCGIKLNRSLNISELAQNNSDILINKSDLKSIKNEDLKTGLLNTAINNNNNEFNDNFEQKPNVPEVKISLSNKKTRTRKRKTKKMKSRNNSRAKKRNPSKKMKILNKKKKDIL